MSINIDLSTGVVSNENNSDDDADTITVDGEEVPRFDERIPEGEAYAFVGMVSYELGAKVGESDLSSALYDPDRSAFPNRAVGQSEENPEGNLSDAISPGHFVYRKFGAGDVKKGIKKEFHQVLKDMGMHDKHDSCTILDYKKNFPERDMADMDGIQGISGEFVTVEERDDEWNNVQVPVEWEELWGGMPPVVMEEPDDDPEPEPDGESLEVPDDFGAGLNKGETIAAALDEFEVLRTVDQEVAVQALQAISGASKTYTYDCYNDYFTDDDESAITPEDMETLRKAKAVLDKLE